MSDLVPGVMRCAKCKLRLLRRNLYLKSGTIGAGDSKTEPCPNGCGPLWPVTWEEEAREGYKIQNAQVEREIKLKAALLASQEREHLATQEWFVEHEKLLISQLECERLRELVRDLYHECMDYSDTPILKRAEDALSAPSSTDALQGDAGDGTGE